MRQPLTRGLVLACLFAPAAAAQGQIDINEETEQAMKAAALKAASSVVRIETSGGQDSVVWSGPMGTAIRKVLGPTTGLVVDADGYVVTSSFNFINKPTDIIVTVPGKGKSVGKVVGIDQSRMLTLLKIDKNGLTVPEAFPKSQIDVGLWSLALGRTLNPNLDQPPSISAGIISAVGRIWGKAVQTDAKISPNNYGGPLVAIDGRVIGVLVPASHQSEGDNAGVEWYDSGIGFAVPLEDINRVLPKLKAGSAEKPVTLRGGLFGFPQPEPNDYLNPPVISQVIPESAAEKAGIKAGDLILSVDGKPLYTLAQFLHVIKPRYEGDSFALKIKRGDKELEIPKVVLLGVQTATDPGFLGILPMRDDPNEGVEVRYVYPNSPAAKAGLKPGDRIMKLGSALAKEPAAFAGRDRFLQMMSHFTANTDVKLEVKRKDGGKTDEITARLVSFSEDVPELPLEPASRKHALEKPKDAGKKARVVKDKGPDPAPEQKEPAPEEIKKEPREIKKSQPNGEDADPKKEETPPAKDKERPRAEEEKKEPKEASKDEAAKPDDGAKKDPKKVDKGLLKRSNAARGHNYWVFVPRDYDPNIAYGVLIWLHPPGREGRDADDMVDLWEDFCYDHHMIMLGPISENKSGWVPSELDNIIDDLNAVIGQYTVDQQRIVVHAAGDSGRMAYYLGFNARDQIRGVATVGTMLSSQPKDLVANQRLQFYSAAGAKDPIIKDIVDSKPKLTERKYSVVLKVIEDKGKEYISDSPAAFRQLMRWIDSLDRN